MTLLRAPFSLPAVAAKLRPAFEAQKHLLVPGACDPAAFELPPFDPFFVADRGRYEQAALAPLPELLAFAEAVSGLRLEHAWTRVIRLRPRSYALHLDDALARIERGVELMLDLSPDLGGPPVVWTSGLRVPQMPGLLALVERTPTTYRHDRYLPESAGDATVVRLRAAFTRVD